jgi:hypothetical protein
LVSSDPAVRQAFDQGVREAIDLRNEVASSPDRETEIFNRYCDTVLIPAIVLNREIDGCRNESAVVFCSNWAAHCPDNILRKLAHCGILVLIYPSQALRLFQELDVLLFAVLKRTKRYEQRSDTFPVMVDHFVQLFRAYEKATPSTTVRASWNKTGFDYERRDSVIHLAVTESKIRQLLESREVRGFNDQPTRLTERRGGCPISGDGLTNIYSRK